MSTAHIRTFTGKTFFPLNPKSDDIDIVDIAHSLSNMCRFVGHCTEFYSVAQHSVLVSYQVPVEHALWGLLHDASEAYISDVATPIKRMPEMKAYCEAEDKLMLAVCKAFGLDFVEPDSVAIADKRMLATEQRCLGSSPHNTTAFEPYDFKIMPLLPSDAKRLYLARYKELTGT